MPTHAELTGKLLDDAAVFFTTLASQNDTVATEMNENAEVFKQMSILITEDPQGSVNEKPNALLASKLLKDAATFFRSLAEQNPPIAEQMEENASVFEQMSGLVEKDPMGIID